LEEWARHPESNIQEAKGMNDNTVKISIELEPAEIRTLVRKMFELGTNWILDEVMDYVSRMRNKRNFNHPMSYPSFLEYFRTMRADILLWDKESYKPEMPGTNCPMKALRRPDGSIAYSHLVDGLVVPVPKEPIRKMEEAVEEMIQWATKLEEVTKANGGHIWEIPK
jgi:hypothetical protein